MVGILRPRWYLPCHTALGQKNVDNQHETSAPRSKSTQPPGPLAIQNILEFCINYFCSMLIGCLLQPCPFISPIPLSPPPFPVSSPKHKLLKSVELTQLFTTLFTLWLVYLECKLLGTGTVYYHVCTEPSPVVLLWKSLVVVITNLNSWPALRFLYVSLLIEEQPLLFNIEGSTVLNTWHLKYCIQSLFNMPFDCLKFGLNTLGLLGTEVISLSLCKNYRIFFKAFISNIHG